jgi:hypothetical protein
MAVREQKVACTMKLDCGRLEILVQLHGRRVAAVLRVPPVPAKRSNYRRPWQMGAEV